MSTEIVSHLAARLARLESKLDAVCAKFDGRTKPLLTVEETADLVGRTPYTIRRWITEGRIRAQRISGTGPRGRLLISRDELTQVVAMGLGAKVT